MDRSGRQLMEAAERMDERLRYLRNKINGMGWDAASRQQYNETLDEFERAYSRLRVILHDLGGAVVEIANRSKLAEVDLERMWRRA